MCLPMFLKQMILFQGFYRDSGVWTYDGSIPWSTSGNNTLIFIPVDGCTRSYSYTVTSTTLTLTAADGSVIVLTKTAVTIP